MTTEEINDTLKILDNYKMPTRLADIVIPSSPISKAIQKELDDLHMRIGAVIDNAPEKMVMSSVALENYRQRNRVRFNIKKEGKVVEYWYDREQEKAIKRHRRGLSPYN
jgi:hypothetical protein